VAQDREVVCRLAEESASPRLTSFLQSSSRPRHDFASSPPLGFTATDGRGLIIPIVLRIAGEDEDVPLLAAGLAALFSTGFSYFLIRSGGGGTTFLDVSDVNGQLAFAAPADGDYVVELQYPARRWLIAVALAAIVAGWWLMRALPPRGPARSAGCDPRLY